MYDSIYVLTCLLLDHVCLMLGLQTDARKHIIGENIGRDSIVARLARLPVACAPLDDYFISNSIIHLKCRSLSGSKRSTSNHAQGTCTEQVPTRASLHLFYRRRRPRFEVEPCMSHGLCKSDQSLIHQYGRSYMQLVVKCPVCLVGDTVLVEEGRE
jgi:hypothetical protein